MGRNLCHIDLRSPVMILRLVLRLACVLSKIPIVWACLVVAVSSLMPNVRMTSLMIVDVNCVPLSVIIVVGM